MALKKRVFSIMKKGGKIKLHKNNVLNTKTTKILNILSKYGGKNYQTLFSQIKL